MGDVVKDAVDATRLGATPPEAARRVPAAPAVPGFLSPAPLDQLQGRWRWGWAYAGAWLVFLVPAFRQALADPDRPRGTAAATLLLAFCVFYLRLWSTLRARRVAGEHLSGRWRYGMLGVAAGLMTACVLLIGQEALAMATFLTVLVMFLLPSPARMIATTGVVAITAAATEFVPGWHRNLGTVLGLVLTAFVMWGIVQMIERNAQLQQAHRQLAEMAVVEERARFARDLHDLLGHSLTLLAMKAELAGRLVRLDADRAEQEIAEVERLARDALVDVRAAVGGYRQATLTGELVAARAVLDAAGIEAEMPTAVDEVPGERRELLGWAVREGVTNVVRHSGAGRCRILVHPDGVEIIDDGCGPGAVALLGGWTTGSGLRGLRERAQTAGASVVVASSPEGGFRLRVGW